MNPHSHKEQALARVDRMARLIDQWVSCHYPAYAPTLDETREIWEKDREARESTRNEMLALAMQIVDDAIQAGFPVDKLAPLTQLEADRPFILWGPEARPEDVGSYLERVEGDAKRAKKILPLIAALLRNQRSGDAAASSAPLPAAAPHAPLSAIVLNEQARTATVNGKPKALTLLRYKIIKILCDAFPERLPSAILVAKTTFDAPRILRTMARDDPDWKRAILLPGPRKGMGYGIAARASGTPSSEIL